MKNDGLIEGHKESAWLAGVIPYEVRVPSGDWRPFMPDGEYQRLPMSPDTMACVTFAELNSLETQSRQRGKNVNFSDRFTAKISGTTSQGNYLDRVADAIRHWGVVLESEYPAPPTPFTWDEYYAAIPDAVAAMAQRINVRYEFLEKPFSRDDLKYHLKQSPLVVTIPGHAVMLVASEEDVDFYLDSYKKFLKEYESPFVSAMKLVYYDSIIETPMTETEVVKLYVLAFYREPDATEKAYWIGKTLGDFLATAIKDRAAFLKSHE